MLTNQLIFYFFISEQDNLPVLLIILAFFHVVACLSPWAQLDSGDRY